LSRPLRLTLVVAGIVAVLAALGYAAHSMNLIGMLISMHAPPQH
jgi:hypothetical protein